MIVTDNESLNEFWYGKADKGEHGQPTVQSAEYLTKFPYDMLLIPTKNGHIVETTALQISEPERSVMIYEIDESLRLVFRDGQYDGWYNAAAGADVSSKNQIVAQYMQPDVLKRVYDHGLTLDQVHQLFIDMLDALCRQLESDHGVYTIANLQLEDKTIRIWIEASRKRQPPTDPYERMAAEQLE